MGKVKLAVLVKDKNISISTDDTGNNILTYLALVADRVISEMSVKHEKTLRKKLCDMILSAPVKVDYTSKDFEHIVAESLNRMKGTKE